MIDILKNKKLNKTLFRKEVLAIFNRYNNAIPLSVIEKELKTFNRITLYRTIKIFIQKGIIHKILLNDGVANYAICQEQCSTMAHYHQHIHFKCTNCKVVSCVEVDQFPALKLPNYKIDQLEIQATGLCINCNLLS